MAMSDYLSVVTPDYAGDALAVTPQTVMPEDASKNIIVHKGDDGSEKPVILSDTVVFYVTLQWPQLGAADADTIMDYWVDPAKANGKAYTFKWTHPIELIDYVVRFDSNIQKNVAVAAIYGIASIRLRVLGVAA